MPEIKETRVQWSLNEWDKLAEELYCIRPTPQYQQSDSLVSLTLADMADIQKCLPEDRRRNLNSVATVRPKMIEAMKRLRVRLTAAQSVTKAEQESKARAEAEALAAAANKPNPYELAFAPLVDLIASAVEARMQAKLEQLVSQLMPQAQVQLDEVTKPAAFRKVRIGVLGPLEVQGNAIREAFPDVEFIIEDNKSSTIPAWAGRCDKIIGMTDLMSHVVDNKMRQKYPDKYHRTTGNSSSVKRLVQVLLSSMGHQGKPQVNMH